MVHLCGIIEVRDNEEGTHTNPKKRLFSYDPSKGHTYTIVVHKDTVGFVLLFLVHRFEEQSQLTGVKSESVCMLAFWKENSF